MIGITYFLAIIGKIGTIEAINACSGDEIVIGLNGPKENQDQSAEKKTRTEGTLIYSPNDNNTRYVVMPYNI